MEDNENSENNGGLLLERNNDHAVSYSKPQRPRTILQPLDDVLLNHRMMINTREVLINNLMDESVFEMNLNRNYIDSQIVRIIIPSSDQKATLYSIRRSRTQTAEVHFKRIYQCRIFSVGSITEQSRLIYLMESKNSNNVLPAASANKVGSD